MLKDSHGEREQINHIAMTTDATIKWFAFEDPKTKREYFFEPNSKVTTWVLPTSSKPITSKIDKKSTMKHQDHNASHGIEENKMGINTSSSTKLGWIIMATLVVSLICNTVFLIALVNLTGPHTQHSTASSIIFEVPNEDAEQLNESLSELISQDDGSSMDISAEDINYVNEEFPKDGSDNAQIPTNEPEECPHEMEGYSQPQDAINLENVENEETQAFQEVVIQETVEYSHQQKPSAEIKNNLPHPNRSIMVPVECWVPFAYVFNRGCRRNGHKRLQRPMFDAEQFAGAII